MRGRFLFRQSWIGANIGFLLADSLLALAPAVGAQRPQASQAGTPRSIDRSLVERIGVDLSFAFWRWRRDLGQDRDEFRIFQTLGDWRIKLPPTCLPRHQSTLASAVVHWGLHR